MNRYIVHYENKNGSCGSRSVEANDIDRYVRNLRKPAKIMLDGRVVGGVVRADRGWEWWYETPDSKSP
jgi:hypothetical protein